MKFRKYKEYIGTLILFSSFLSTLGNPVSGLGGEEVDFPFGNCKKYHLGGKGGYPLIEEKPWKLAPVFAIYPMTDEKISLAFHVTFPRAILKINIEGTMITIENCNLSRECKMENEEGVKHVDYIKPHQWNKVKLHVDPQKLEIYIGDRKVLSKSMEDHVFNEDEVHWRLIESKKTRRNSKARLPDSLYLVQFMCPEFVDIPNPNIPNETANIDNYDYESNYGSNPTLPHEDPIPGRNDGPKPGSNEGSRPGSNDGHKPESKPNIPKDVTVYPEPHITDHVTEHHNTAKPHSEHATSEEEHTKSNDGKYVGLIVGLVVAAVIIVTLVIVIYNVIKKRRSMAVTETSPLSPDQKQQETKH